ncbi:MAG: DMT family transporter [Phyllobacterium sp.]
MAIACMLAAGFLFSCLDASAKYLVTNGMEASFVSWVRFVEHAILALFVLRFWANPRVFQVKNLPLQIVRGICLFGSTYFNFFALRTMQLGETISIYFAAPMVITALAGPLLGEWAGWRRWMAIIFAFFGVLIVARPGVAVLNPGLPYIILSMLSYVAYVLLTRKMTANETPDSLIFFSALAPTVLMSPAVTQATMPENGLQLGLLLMLGIFGGVGHWLLIKAYKSASTTALAPYPFFQIIWMITFGYFIFGQFPDEYTLIGATVIILSGLYVVYRERRLNLQTSAAGNPESEEIAKKL